MKPKGRDFYRSLTRCPNSIESNSKLPSSHLSHFVFDFARFAFVCPGRPNRVAFINSTSHSAFQALYSTSCICFYEAFITEVAGNDLLWFATPLKLGF